MTTQTTRPGSVQYGSLLLGPGTPYRWKKLTGWEELPALDSGTVARSGAHGAYPGALLAQPRTITFENMVIRAPVEEIGEAMRVLSAGTGLVDEEVPLLIHTDERGPLLAFARITKRAVPVDKEYAVGTITGAALQFEASDPRRYEPAEQCAETGLPEPCLDWHRDDEGDLLRGIPASTGNLTVRNWGGAPTHPVITFRGPVGTPSLTNEATGVVLEYGVQLDEGDKLTVDTYASSVVLNGAENLHDTATARSYPEELFTLPPGDTALAFRSRTAPDPHARAVLRWRSAHW
ncbi:phage tail family protein [Streptomyces sp. NA04227]|uniref:phage distal tail protein n=1 Tax=Streptomyces sp. NA04227 TaxID=2742136 RepID=UPI00159067FC|nr:phage tail domain-containing protein [Streptomyces sp. NA04227]QKW08037.1 phage tail family protein [Streptomyces sp. NA04227]